MMDPNASLPHSGIRSLMRHYFLRDLGTRIKQLVAGSVSR